MSAKSSALSVQSERPTIPSDAGAPRPVVEALDDPDRLVELAQGVTKGDENAPVTIIEFGDFHCAGCQAGVGAPERLSRRPRVTLRS
jgi:protein-disulfide isomerase